MLGGTRSRAQLTFESRSPNTTITLILTGVNHHFARPASLLGDIPEAANFYT